MRRAAAALHLFVTLACAQAVTEPLTNRTAENEHVFELRDDGSVLHSFNGTLSEVEQHEQKQHRPQQLRLQPSEGGDDVVLIIGDDEADNVTEQLRLLEATSRRAGPRRQHGRHFDMFEMMQREALAQRAEQMRRVNEVVARARHAGPTFVGGTVLPLLLILCLVSCCIQSFDAELHARAVARVQAVATGSPLGHALATVQQIARQRGVSMHDVTRVCVCCFFVHEGLAVFQTKLAQVEQARVPLWTPFGLMRAVPPWEKSDAMDMVLFFTALATLLNRLPELGLVLLLVDVVTDTIDLLARLTLATMVGQEVRIDELTAKKLSLLGVMVLVATHRYREERAALAERAASAAARRAGAAEDLLEKTGAAAAVSFVPSSLLLVGRLLMATIFFYAAGSELGRVLVPAHLSDIDPDDPHNVIWPKLVEVALAIPFVLGYRTFASARALACTLAVEAVTCWQFWTVDPLPARLHAREHFTVNVAVGGGLLLVAQVGGGKLSVDSLLKRD